MALKYYNLRFKLIGLEGFIYKNSKYVSSATHVHQNHFHSISPKNVKRLNQTSVVNWKNFFHFQSSCCAPKTVPFILSDIGEGIVEVEVKDWYIKTGDKVSQFDPICEVQSDKASVTITSRYDGIVKKLNYEIGAIAKVGSPLCEIETEDDQSQDDIIKDDSSLKAIEQPISTLEDDIDFRNKVLATPAVRRIAKENNIKLNDVRGTGKGGRVLKEDVISYLDNLNTPKKTPAPAPLAQEDRIEEIKGFKKAMVKTMTTAWTVPHFSYCDEVDAGELVRIKEDLNRIGKRNNVKITYMPFFVKSASLALHKFPVLNSHVDEKCEYITMKYAHNIGVAMDTPHGLVVPNVKNVQNLSIVEIARELNRLQESGEKGQLKMEDLTGGTFTLSNIGAIGGTYAKPIIFTPQVAIGALGKIQVLPRLDERKNLIESYIFNISWSADHRVIDGATVARFSNLWKLYVANPRLLLHL